MPCLNLVWRRVLISEVPELERCHSQKGIREMSILDMSGKKKNLIREESLD